MPWVDVDQNSVDWLQMRCGCPTASHAYDITAKAKRQKEGDPPKYLACRSNYKKSKVREWLTGLSADGYVSPYMERGLEVEPLARAAYEMQTGCDVEKGGIFIHDKITKFMASPDGRIGDDGLLEVKYLTGSTTEANHLDLLEGAEIPEEYKLQMTAQMACSGRQWVDFVSYDPDMPKHLQLFVKRFPRDPVRIEKMEREVVQFLTEVIELLKKLEAK